MAIDPMQDDPIGAPQETPADEANESDAQQQAEQILLQIQDQPAVMQALYDMLEQALNSSEQEPEEMEGGDFNMEGMEE